MHTCWNITSTFSHKVDKSAIVLTSCLQTASRSVRGNNSGLSQVFPEHLHSSMCVHDLLGFLEICQSFSKFLQTSYFLGILLNIFGYSIIYSRYYLLVQAFVNLSKCLQLFSANAPKEKDFCTGQGPCQIKERQHCKWGLPRNDQRN